MREPGVSGRGGPIFGLLFGLLGGLAVAVDPPHRLAGNLPSAAFLHHKVVFPILDIATSEAGDGLTVVIEDGPESGSGRQRRDVARFIVDLEPNLQLLPEGFWRRTHSRGRDLTVRPQPEEPCHYKGNLRGVPGSWAALSNCGGDGSHASLNGVIFDGFRMHYLQEAPGTVDGAHYLYQEDDLIREDAADASAGAKSRLKRDDVGGSTESLAAGSSSSSSSKDQEASKGAPKTPDPSRVSSSIKGPWNANKRSRYLELVLVVDNKEYKEHGEDLDKVIRICKDIANIMNALYTPLNIYIALVGVVVWTEYDEIEMSANGDKMLTNFLHYRRERLVKDFPNDNAQLLTGVQFDGGVVGKALKGPICTYEFSGGVNMWHSDVVGLLATTVAHELGHNFGMEHDTDNCECPDDRCIMAPASSTMKPSFWSSCSLKYLALAFEHGMDYCLRNKPAALFDGPVCGNGFVEGDEECDCGLKANCDNPCCDPNSCTLYPNSTCATGACCDLASCKPKSPGQVCRLSEHECDLPEFCTGMSEYCPHDIFKVDGTSCKFGEAFCYKGTCQTHSDQCKLLWGPTGKKSDNQCYDQNKNGIRHGNCGYDRINQSYVRCPEADVMCGMLHCSHLNERLEFGMESVAILSHSFINSGGRIIPCRTALVDMGLNDMDPGLSPDGAKCSEESLCVDQKCVPVAALPVGPDSCPSNCSGNGICNNLGHCHCHVGFGPPDCQGPGPGGSLDSGPATLPDQGDRLSTELRAFLYFCLALLLIILAIGAIYLLLLLLRLRAIKQDSGQQDQGDGRFPPLSSVLGQAKLGGAPFAGGLRKDLFRPSGMFGGKKQVQSSSTNLASPSAGGGACGDGLVPEMEDGVLPRSLASSPNHSLLTNNADTAEARTEFQRIGRGSSSLADADEVDAEPKSSSSSFKRLRCGMQNLLVARSVSFPSMEAARQRLRVGLGRSSPRRRGGGPSAKKKTRSGGGGAGKYEIKVEHQQNNNAAAAAASSEDLRSPQQPNPAASSSASMLAGSDPANVADPEAVNQVVVDTTVSLSPAAKAGGGSSYQLQIRAPPYRTTLPSSHSYSFRNNKYGAASSSRLFSDAVSDKTGLSSMGLKHQHLPQSATFTSSSSSVAFASKPVSISADSSTEKSSTSLLAGLDSGKDLLKVKPVLPAKPTSFVKPVVKILAAAKDGKSAQAQAQDEEEDPSENDSLIKKSPNDQQANKPKDETILRRPSLPPTSSSSKNKGLEASSVAPQMSKTSTLPTLKDDKLEDIVAMTKSTTLPAVGQLQRPAISTASSRPLISRPILQAATPSAASLIERAPSTGVSQSSILSKGRQSSSGEATPGSGGSTSLGPRGVVFCHPLTLPSPTNPSNPPIIHQQNIILNPHHCHVVNHHGSNQGQQSGLPACLRESGMDEDQGPAVSSNLAALVPESSKGVILPTSSSSTPSSNGSLSFAKKFKSNLKLLPSTASTSGFKKAKKSSSSSPEEPPNNKSLSPTESTVASSSSAGSASDSLFKGANSGGIRKLQISKPILQSEMDLKTDLVPVSSEPSSDLLCDGGASETPSRRPPKTKAPQPPPRGGAPKANLSTLTEKANPAHRLILPVNEGATSKNKRSDKKHLSVIGDVTLPSSVAAEAKKRPASFANSSRPSRPTVPPPQPPPRKLSSADIGAEKSSSSKAAGAAPDPVYQAVKELVAPLAAAEEEAGADVVAREARFNSQRRLSQPEESLLPTTAKTTASPLTRRSSDTLSTTSSENLGGDLMKEILKEMQHQDESIYSTLVRKDKKKRHHNKTTTTTNE